MSKIQFRLAKPSDAKQIAYVHYHIRDKYDVGFGAHVNHSFLTQYYKAALNDPYQIVVCAEDENKKIVGFSSGTLDTEQLFRSLRKNRLKFVIPLICSAFSNPKVIKMAFDRYRATKGKKNLEYVPSKGSRVEYWGWLPGRKDSDQSIIMQDILYYTMKMCGIDKINFEVDKVNKKIYKFHKINGAIETKSFITPDGRERVELYYDMNNYNFKLK